MPVKPLNRDLLRQVYDRASGRYDLYHTVVTAGSDQRGREILVRGAVRENDLVLDCGAGTGSTALLAGRAAGEEGRVVLFDLSRGMLAQAREKMNREGTVGAAECCAGDMLRLPFPDGAFDAVLSAYSVCPLYDPEQGALELYRVVKPGGRLGVAHSDRPRGRFMRWAADRVERLIWLFPAVSLGCRAVSILPALLKRGAKLLCDHSTGVPLWPFRVFVLQKPGERP